MLGLKLYESAGAVADGRQIRARFPVLQQHVSRFYRQRSGVVLESGAPEADDLIVGVFFPAEARRSVEYWRGYVLPVLDADSREHCWVQVYKVSYSPSAADIDDDEAWCEGCETADEVRENYSARHGRAALVKPAWLVDFGVFLGSHPLIPADFPSFRCWVPGPVEARMYSSDVMSACESMPFTGIRRFWQKIASHPEAAQFVMRGTNLRDCHGREIFEGDLLRMPAGAGGEMVLIRWETVRFTVHAPWSGLAPGEAMREVEQNSRQFEIIGNIFENPAMIPELGAQQPSSVPTRRG